MLAHKENPRRTLFPHDSKALAMNMKVGLSFRDEREAGLRLKGGGGAGAVHSLPEVGG